LFVATGGYPPLPYVAGRFSSSRISVEYLKRKLGYVRLDDVAVGGAATDTRNVEDYSPQLTGGPFGGAQTQVSELLLQAGNTVDDDLVVAFADANNYLLDDTNPVTVVQSLADAIVDLILQGGATRFVVPNLPNLGDTPYGLSQGAATAQALNQLTAAHNAVLAAAMAQIESDFAQQGLEIEILIVDVNSFFAEIVERPRAFGFTTVNAPCFDQSAGTVCSNPKRHLFWDSVHPTTRAHFFFSLSLSLSLYGLRAINHFFVADQGDVVEDESEDEALDAEIAGF
jgi:outer membrane lipase/esterase